MAATAEPAHASALERSWWLRAPAVLVAPTAVFASLRDESEDAVDARTDPLAALIGLAGFASVLGTPVARALLNDFDFSVVLIPVWTFFGGAGYALAVFWLGGAVLHGATRRFGSLGAYRRARHTIALASAPLALAMCTLWPVRIAIYGEDLFRTGGNDWGPGDRIFGALLYAAFVWSGLLLVVGVRAVHGWSWPRSVAAVGLAGAGAAAVIFLFYLAFA